MPQCIVTELDVWESAIKKIRKKTKWCDITANMQLHQSHALDGRNKKGNVENFYQ